MSKIIFLVKQGQCINLKRYKRLRHNWKAVLVIKESRIRLIHYKCDVL